MLITEEERFAYFASWEMRVLRDCQVLLEQFKCCDRLIQHISDYISWTGKSTHAAMTPADAQKSMSRRRCPYCEDGWVLQQPMPTCEVERTGRVMYEECISCDFWSETYQKSQLTYTWEFGELKEVK